MSQQHPEGMTALLREGLCMLCEREYPGWFAPNKLWNTFMRLEDGSDLYPFICPTCFGNFAVERGLDGETFMFSTEYLAGREAAQAEAYENVVRFLGDASVAGKAVSEWFLGVVSEPLTAESQPQAAPPTKSALKGETVEAPPRIRIADFVKLSGAEQGAILNEMSKWRPWEDRVRAIVREEMER